MTGSRASRCKLQIGSGCTVQFTLRPSKFHDRKLAAWCLSDRHVATFAAQRRVNLNHESGCEARTPPWLGPIVGRKGTRCWSVIGFLGKGSQFPCGAATRRCLIDKRNRCLEFLRQTYPGNLIASVRRRGHNVAKFDSLAACSRQFLRRNTSTTTLRFEPRVCEHESSVLDSGLPRACRAR